MNVKILVEFLLHRNMQQFTVGFMSVGRGVVVFVSCDTLLSARVM